MVAIAFFDLPDKIQIFLLLLREGRHLHLYFLQLVNVLHPRVAVVDDDARLA